MENDATFPAPMVSSTPLETFVRNNGFYVISACLMLLGCYLCMPDAEFIGDHLAKTLKALGMLQAYELLVIATACVVARRFRVMGDGFTLLLIELVLLLDPTFFSNSLFTMALIGHALAGPLVNGGCLVLALVKLAVLSHFLRLRLTGRAWASLAVCLGLVYLSEWPLINKENTAYYFALGWALPLAAWLTPALRHVMRPLTPGEGFITERQHTRLSRAFALLPLAIFTLHYFESAQVHDLGFYGLHLAPILIAAGFLVTNNIDRSRRSTLIYLMDALAFLALSLTYISTHVTSRRLPAGQSEAVFLATVWPLVACGLGVVMLYGWYGWRLRYPKAWWRIAALAAAVGLVKGYPLITLPSGLWTAIKHLIIAVGGWLITPWIFFVLAGAVLWIVALIKRSKGLLWVAGCYTAFYVCVLLELHSVSDVARRFVDIVTWLCFFLFVLAQGLQLSRADRTATSFILAVLALVRLVAFGDLYFLPLFAVQAVFMLTLGVRTKLFGMTCIGLVQCMAALFCLPKLTQSAVPHWGIIVALALIFFAVGLAVTFNKDRTLAWLRSFEPPEPPDLPRSPRGFIAPLPGDQPEQKQAGSQPPLWSGPPDPMGEAAGPLGQPLDVASREEKAEAKMEMETEPEAQPQAQIEVCPAPVQECIPTPIPMAESQVQPAAQASSAVQEKSQPAADRDRDMTCILRALFIHDPNQRVVHFDQLESSRTGEILRTVKLEPGERIEVCFQAQTLFGFQWKVLLTTRRLITNEGGYLRSFTYRQIDSISRMFGTLYITGHAGQNYAQPRVGSPQARWLKMGLEKLLPEVALDRMGPWPRS